MAGIFGIFLLKYKRYINVRSGGEDAVLTPIKSRNMGTWPNFAPISMLPYIDPALQNVFHKRNIQTTGSVSEQTVFVALGR